MFGAQGAGGGFNFAPTASSTGSTPGTGFSFGTSNAASSTPATGFSFGAPAANTTTTAAAPPASGTGFSFGGFGAGTSGSAGGLPGFGGLGSSTSAAATTTATAAGGGFNFGAAASKPATSTVPAPATGFGLGASTTSATAAPNAGISGFSLGVGSAVTGGSMGLAGLGGNVSANAQTTTLPGTAATASTAATGIGFGATAPKSTAGSSSLLSGLLGSTQGASLSTASTTTASTGFSLGGASTGAPISSAPPGFSFGAPPSLGQSAAATSTTTTSLGAGFGLSGLAASAAATTSGAATSTAIVAPSLPGGQKQMTFRQLEDTINKWTTELEDQEKCFLDQATQVNAWDRLVMENGEKIIQLNKDLERVKLDQQKLDHELDFVNSQQNELAELLTPLEAALDELPPISHTQHAQLEREHTYTLAESLDSQLKRMSQDLKEIVERLNSTNVKPDDNDPLQQITKILNAHVVSLMWVDRNSSNLQRRAEEIAKMMDLEKKEQERNFRMAYS